MPSVFVLLAAPFLGLVAASALVPTAADNCAAYPAIDSYLGKCKTATPFCESLLGRGPRTMTESYKTYTTTIPKTLTWKEVSTMTVTGSTVLPVFTSYSTFTIVSCPSTTSTAVGKVNVALPTPIAAVGPSCGVGQYSAAWISTACSCEIDSTVIVASKTVTKKSSTVISLSSFTATSYTTHTSYLSTTSATTTYIDTNCYPPANASCLNPTDCSAFFFESYKCGSSPNSYGCICGYDYHDQAACYKSNFKCANAPSCTYDYDCNPGHFCLYDGFDEDVQCCSGPGGVCVMADTCIGDQPSTTFIPSTATSLTAAAGGVVVTRHAIATVVG